MIGGKKPPYIVMKSTFFASLQLYNIVDRGDFIEVILTLLGDFD